MGVNKVVFGAVSIMDISDSTVTEDTLVEGSTAYGADGEKLIGTNPYKKAETDAEVNTQATLISEILETLDGKAGGGGTSGGITMPSEIKAGNTPVLSSATMAHTCTSTSATATGISITVPRAGTYRFKFSCARTNTTGTYTAQLRKNGTAVSGATATWSSYQGSCTADISCNANDKIEIYSTSRGTSYRLITGQLIACIDWNTGF